MVVTFPIALSTIPIHIPLPPSPQFPTPTAHMLASLPRFPCTMLFRHSSHLGEPHFLRQEIPIASPPLFPVYHYPTTPNPSVPYFIFLSYFVPPPVANLTSPELQPSSSNEGIIRLHPPHNKVATVAPMPERKNDLTHLSCPIPAHYPLLFA